MRGDFLEFFVGQGGFSDRRSVDIVIYWQYTT